MNDLQISNTMAVSKKTLKICSKGHKFFKSSTCPVCPICENEKQSKGFLALISAPARRALESKGISTLKQLAKFSEKELLELHGIGPSAIPILRTALKQKDLQFKK